MPIIGTQPFAMLSLIHKISLALLTAVRHTMKCGDFSWRAEFHASTFAKYYGPEWGWFAKETIFKYIPVIFKLPIFFNPGGLCSDFFLIRNVSYFANMLRSVLHFRYFVHSWKCLFLYFISHDWSLNGGITINYSFTLPWERWCSRQNFPELFVTSVLSDLPLPPNGVILYESPPLE